MNTQTNNQNKKIYINKSEILPEQANSVPKKTNNTANSIELVCQLPKDIITGFTKDVIGGVLSGFTLQLLGQPTSESFKHTPEKYSASKEAMMWKKRYQYTEYLRKEQETVFIRKQQATEQKIISLRQELKLQVSTFSRDMVSWAQEIDVAGFQAPINPGIYHENFYDQLVKFVKNLRKRINSSRMWLRAHNAKAKKKQGLWALAQNKKANTFNQEILFSGERAVSMSG